MVMISCTALDFQSGQFLISEAKKLLEHGWSQAIDLELLLHTSSCV